MPGIARASMNRMSPPAGVQARPVDTPGSLVRRLVSRNTFCLPRNSVTCFSSTVSPLAAFLGHHARELAGDGADLPLEAADARLAGVVLDDRREGARR